MSNAYVRSLMESVEVERAKYEAEREEQARIEAQSTRERMVPLSVRLSKLVSQISEEVQAEGLCLETLRKMLRGAKGRGAHSGAIGDELRRMGWRRVRSWKKSENGFRALWFPPS
jgi:hypothetical protein